MKQLFLLIAAFLLLSANLSAQIYTVEDEAVFERYATYIQPYRSASKETVLEKTALFFVGSPYVAGTLEIADEEQLVVNLREFDCVTYIETVIALAEAAQSTDFSFETYLDKLRHIRYRSGKQGNYATRLHYASDWVHDNEVKGVLKNISQKLGGAKETKKINFMSAHRQSYKQLKADDVMLQDIENMENAINTRGGFYYLPKEKINNVAAHIPHMAMIGFTTKIGGLDTTHTGFAYKKDGKLTFVHASAAQKKVVIDSKTLSDYCAGQKSCTGVIVAECL